jgi:large conductance mechanosensitive channel
MLKGFKEFLLRGNIIELAVAVVIGAAFTALVTNFTTSFIDPILARIGGVDAPGLVVHLGDPNNPATDLDFGRFLTAVVTFLITAAVVYFIFVLPLNKLAARRKKNMVSEEAAPPSDNDLLVEIRDLLKAAKENTRS